MSTSERKRCDEQWVPLPQNPPGSHCCKMNISCFSEARKNVANGKCIASDAVVAGGHSWRVIFFPNGNLPDTTDAISIYLLLQHEHNGANAEEDIRYCVNMRFKLYEVGGGPPRFTSADLAHVFTVRSMRAHGFERFVTVKDLEESGVLSKHDCFTIACEFTNLSTMNIARPVIPTMPPASALPEPSVQRPSELHADLGRLLETKERADVQFEVRGKVFAAHKFVLAARSPVFEAQFFGPTEEETTTTSNCKCISDMDPKTFEAMLYYMYTDTLPKMEKDEDAILTLDLLVAADRYNLKGLKSKTEDELFSYVDTRRVFKMLAVAEGYQCWKLKETCLEFIGSRRNTGAVMINEDVENLARSCPSVVKDVIAKILDAKGETLCHDSLVSNIDYVMLDFYFILFAVCTITFWVVRCVFF